ncbi:MAG: hypothetical protein Q8Q18_00735 [bacterium]|nr:hypothetical protein [bacterium]
MADTKGLADATALRRVLLQHAHERVTVLGVPGAGKSTLAKLILGTLDMDNILFPQLTADERAFVFQKPWIPEVGIEMKRLAQKWIIVRPGAPVFATVLLNADLIVHLQISDNLLRQRIVRKDRPQPFELCNGVQRQLETDILESGIPYYEFELKEENQDR